MSTPPDPVRPSAFRDPMAIFWLLGGLLLIGFGGYRMYLAKGQSQTGALLLAAGLTMIPVPIIALLGGVGLIGVGIWILTLPGKSSFDYMVMLLAFLFGVAAITEQWRKLRPR